MIRKQALWLGLAALVAGLALMAAGCAETGGKEATMAAPAMKAAPAAKAAPAMVPCAAKLEQQIAAEAQVVGFTCFVDKYKGKPSLHFKVTLKNVSKEEQRFRVNIFLDDGKAVGGLIPEKTKGGLVKPGTEAGFTYPVQGYTGTPAEVMLVVKTMSK